MNQIKVPKDDIERFITRNGYSPNLENPKSFSERLMIKKWTSRDPLFPMTADKAQVRDWLTYQGLEHLLMPIIGVYYNADDLLALDPPYVAKANNASSRMMFVTENTSRKKIREKVNQWLTTPYGVEKGEWAYSAMKPAIVAEPVMWSKNTSHFNYRVFCFHGRAEWVEALECIITDEKKKVANPTHTVFMRPWEFVNVSVQGRDMIENLEKPEGLEKMYEAAEQIAKHFHDVRVDMFLIDGQPYFSEITHYARSARLGFNPKEFDFEVGKFW